MVNRHGQKWTATRLTQCVKTKHSRTGLTHRTSCLPYLLGFHTARMLPVPEHPLALDLLLQLGQAPPLPISDRTQQHTCCGATPSYRGCCCRVFRRIDHSGMCGDATLSEYDHHDLEREGVLAGMLGAATTYATHCEALAPPRASDFYVLT